MTLRTENHEIRERVSIAGVPESFFRDAMMDEEILGHRSTYLTGTVIGRECRLSGTVPHGTICRRGGPATPVVNRWAVKTIVRPPEGTALRIAEGAFLSEHGDWSLNRSTAPVAGLCGLAASARFRLAARGVAGAGAVASSCRHGSREGLAADRATPRYGSAFSPTPRSITDEATITRHGPGGPPGSRYGEGASADGADEGETRFAVSLARVHRGEPSLAQETVTFLIGHGS